MKHKKIALAIVSMASAALLAACGSAPVSNGSAATGNEIGKTIKLGYNLELSGPVAAYGQAEKNGADLAVEEINAAGGVDGKKIEVVSKDNKSDNSEAATVSTNLGTEEKVAAIIGPATSGAVAAATPSATQAGVPLITPSGTQDDLTVKNGQVEEFIFRSTFQDSFQGQVLATYVSDSLSAKKVVLYSDNSSEYAKGITKSFKEAYKGDIVVEETYQSGDKDFQAALTKLKDKEFDVIVIPGYYTEAGLITKQAREMGLDKPILGPDGFADAKFIEGAGAKNASNVYYVSGYSTKVALSEKATAFVEAYTKKYGEEPNMFAALSYDAVYMAAAAAKDAKTSKDVAANLANLKDFEGVTGPISIDKDHNPVKSAIIVKLDNGQEVSAEAVTAK
ncbi:ABC transporter substrate-binding protein [Streptococcus minor]|uniref:ABC transporter substrate-binding protein n=1 Tax=Streptococcus minor TaxID=229549 RepID=UPI00037DB661|nr:ABC transporter substrate-binding protein [Streptococcus minor]